jgi:hypothetical protein
MVDRRPGNEEDVMTTVRKSKATTVVSLQKWNSGIAKHFAGQTLPINGGPFTDVELEAGFTAFIAQLLAADAAKAAWQQLVAAVNSAQTSEIGPRTEALRSYVVALFGKSNPVLLDFGITPAKKTEPSAEVKAEAVTKRAATRDARKTMGKNQKKDIHGTVTEPAAPPAPTPQTPSIEKDAKKDK